MRALRAHAAPGPELDRQLLHYSHLDGIESHGRWCRNQEIAAYEPVFRLDPVQVGSHLVMHPEAQAVSGLNSDGRTGRNTSAASSSNSRSSRLRKRQLLHLMFFGGFESRTAPFERLCCQVEAVQAKLRFSRKMQNMDKYYMLPGGVLGGACTWTQGWRWSWGRSWGNGTRSVQLPASRHLIKRARHLSQCEVLSCEHGWRARHHGGGEPWCS